MIVSLLAFTQALSADTTAASNSKDIVVTASRLPEKKKKSAASTTVIDQKEIIRLGDPLLPSLIRLTPSAAVATSGPAGSLSEVRIRGSEANHTLLFIDGIKINDPAAGDAPRFELLNADIASRLEIVRGPQSALWGSEAIGGVVAVNGVPPSGSSFTAGGEGGSFGFHRENASASLVTNKTSLAVAAGWQRATGIDSFDYHGNKDGYRNFAGRLLGSWEVAPSVELGVTGFYIAGRTKFDGYDPVTFLHADTLDSTKNHLGAGRLWLNFGQQDSGLSGSVSTSLLDSSNRNFVAAAEQNWTKGSRWTTEGQLQYHFSSGRMNNTAIVAFDRDDERFHAGDLVYGGLTDQDRKRTHEAVIGEWRAELVPIVADVAVRHDMFSAFKDATTVRASLLANVGDGFSLTGAYGEGIAQPTFFDLYGFFPGSFVGNPSLKPEVSRGFEASVRYHRGSLDAAVTAYRQRLHDEIIQRFDPVSFIASAANRSAISHRSGVEVELGWSLADWFRVSVNYAYLHATQPDASEIRQVREVRRPKNSGSIALDGTTGRLTYGASLAYVGTRSDTNFDVFPAVPVTLHAYWLAGGRVAYAVRPGLEVFVRGQNLLNERYEDVFGYHTEGRAGYVGFRISSSAGRRSSP